MAGNAEDSEVGPVEVSEVDLVEGSVMNLVEDLGIDHEGMSVIEETSVYLSFIMTNRVVVAELSEKPLGKISQ